MATVHSPYFATLVHNANTALAFQDIESNQFWKAVYFILRAVFPMFRALRYCDATKPAMDYLCDQAQNALLRSNSHLRDYSLFGSLKRNLLKKWMKSWKRCICTKDDLNKNEVLNLLENNRL